MNSNPPSVKQKTWKAWINISTTTLQFSRKCISYNKEPQSIGTSSPERQNQGTPFLLSLISLRTSICMLFANFRVKGIWVSSPHQISNFPSSSYTQWSSNTSPSFLIYCILRYPQGSFSIHIFFLEHTTVTTFDLYYSAGDLPDRLLVHFQQC